MEIMPSVEDISRMEKRERKKQRKRGNMKKISTLASVLMIVQPAVEASVSQGEL